MGGRRRPLAVLFLTVFMDLVGFGIVIPLLPLYAKEWGAAWFTNGLLLASFSLMQFLFAPLWGRWSDRVGRRPVILVSLVGSTLSYVLFAVASLQRSLPLLFASRLLGGVMGANIPVAQAYIADTTEAEERAHGMGLIGAAFGLGFIVGPALAGLLLFLGEAGPGFGAAAICAVNLLLALAWLPESLSPEHRRAGAAAQGRIGATLAALHRPGVRGLLWMFFAFTVAIAVWETTLPAFCNLRLGWDKRVMPWVFVYAGVLMAFVQGFLIRRLRRRASEARLIFAGSAIAGLGFALIAAGNVAWVHLTALAVFSLGGGIASPSLLGLMSRRVGAHEQGEILGVGQSLSSLARVIGPVAGYGLLHIASRLAPDPLAATWDEATPFMLAAFLAVVVMIAAASLARHQGAPGHE